jgi:phenylacetate-CoA ligase
MSKVLGRTDDMLIVRGVNVFPSQIEEALLAVAGLAPQYLILVDRGKDRLDELEVLVEPTPDAAARGEYALRELRQRAEERLQSILGIRASVRIVGGREIERSQGKAARVIDRRASG